MYSKSMLLQHDPRTCLPSAEDLPDSDDAPVYNELQNFIPNFLLSTLFGQNAWTGSSGSIWEFITIPTNPRSRPMVF